MKGNKLATIAVLEKDIDKKKKDINIAKQF